MATRKIKVIGTFKGCSISGAGVSTVKFAADYDEVTRYIKLVTMQDMDVKLAVKDEETKFKTIGTMRIKSINLKGQDGALFTFVGDETINLPLINMFINQLVTFAIVGEVEELEEETDE